MKKYKQSETYIGNGIIGLINGQNPLTHILGNKKEYKPVTDPFMYDGIEFCLQWLKAKDNKNKLRIDSKGYIYQLGSRTVWQLTEIKTL